MCSVLEVDIDIGVMIGMIIVFFYAVMGGMKGITYTQVAQYCVMIFAYLVPALYAVTVVSQCGGGGVINLPRGSLRGCLLCISITPPPPPLKIHSFPRCITLRRKRLTSEKG